MQPNTHQRSHDTSAPLPAPHCPGARPAILLLLWDHRASPQSWSNTIASCWFIVKHTGWEWCSGRLPIHDSRCRPCRGQAPAHRSTACQGDSTSLDTPKESSCATCWWQMHIFREREWVHQPHEDPSALSRAGLWHGDTDEAHELLLTFTVDMLFPLKVKAKNEFSFLPGGNSCDCFLLSKTACYICIRNLFFCSPRCIQEGMSILHPARSPQGSSRD